VLLLNKASVQFCASEEKSRYSIVEEIEKSGEAEGGGTSGGEREKGGR
jgi:hypothetical protein